jgi:hypothetical protein
LENLRPAPPAPAGNGRARVHGGYATVARERLSEREATIRDALDADRPLPASADDALVALLATCLCRLEDVAANVRDYGLLDQATGAVRPVVELEARLRKEAADYLDQLGCSPRSRARLGLDVARTVDLATAMSEPDAERRERLLRDAGVIDDEERDE